MLRRSCTENSKTRQKSTLILSLSVCLSIFDLSATYHLTLNTSLLKVCQICLFICLSDCQSVYLSTSPSPYSVITLRIASSDSTRIATSFSQFVSELNHSCVTSFLQLIDMANQQLVAYRTGTLRPGMIHDHLCRKVTFK